MFQARGGFGDWGFSWFSLVGQGAEGRRNLERECHTHTQSGSVGSKLAGCIIIIGDRHVSSNFLSSTVTQHLVIGGS